MNNIPHAIYEFVERLPRGVVPVAALGLGLIAGAANDLSWEQRLRSQEIRPVTRSETAMYNGVNFMANTSAVLGGLGLVYCVLTSCVGRRSNCASGITPYEPMPTPAETQERSFESPTHPSPDKTTEFPTMNEPQSLPSQKSQKRTFSHNK